MLDELRRFRALDGPAQRLFLQTLALLPLVSLSLRWSGFRATQGALQKTIRDPLPEQNLDLVSRRIARTAHMVNAADRHGLIHPSCLAKSLALWWLLGRQGIASHLRLGIRKEKENIEAHAWVEREGTALNEPDEHHRHYAAFDAAFTSLQQEQH
jgi:transglutaminase superfamily protein